MRLIDADALLKHEVEADRMGAMLVVGKGYILEAPEIAAVPVVRGEWKHTGITNVYGGHQHKCSVCGYSLMVSQSCDNENYCCNCGAKMEDKP